MKKILLIVTTCILTGCLLVFLLTGNILGYEFNSLFPDEPLSVGPADSPLSGKTVVCMGDSIIGMVRNSTSVTAYLAKETGATVYNVGFGGTRTSVHTRPGYAAFSLWMLADAIAHNDWTAQESQASEGSDYFSRQLEILKEIDFSQVDILLLHYGTNDFTASPGIELDNPSDPLDYTTLSGALRYSINTLSEAFPQLQIYVSLPLYRYWPDTGEYPETFCNSLGKYLPDYVEELRETAQECGLFVIDGYTDMGLNRETVVSLTLDGTHLNRYGRKRLGEFIGNYLNEKAGDERSAPT